MNRITLILFFHFVMALGTFAQCSPDATISPAGPVNICEGNSVTLTAPPGNVWTKMTDLTGLERQNAVGFSVGTKGYIGTGRNISATAYSDFWEYDPVNDTWSQKADFGGGLRWGAVGFGIGTKGYVGTGRNGAVTYTDFWEYNPATNVWTSKTAFTGSSRYFAAGFSIGAKGYIGTGWDGTTRYTDFREYDPATNAWTSKAAFTGASRHSAVGFAVGTKGYIGTGSVSTILNETDFYEYNPATNTWAAKLDFPGAGRYAATGFGIGTKGFLGTGFDGTSYYNDFYEYNPTTNTWTARANYGAPACRYAVGFSIDDKGYIGTGLNGTTLYKQFWEYYPACTFSWSSGQTTQTISASTAGSYTVTLNAVTGCNATSAAVVISVITPTAVINPDGENTICQGDNLVLNASGSNNAWTQKANVGGGIRSSAIGFSIGAFGYIGTGEDALGYKKDFWQYNAGTGTWTQKADFGGTARRYAVGFSIGSKGYIGTGSDVGGGTKDFWEYNTVTNSWIQKADYPGLGVILAVGFSIGSKGYLGTGSHNDFWEYDPVLDSWVRKSDYPGSGNYAGVGFCIGTKGYIGLGRKIGFPNPFNDFWEYNPATNTWVQKANFGGSSRSGAVGFGINAKGYVGTGYDGSYKTDFWEYDPGSNNWVVKAVFPGAARNSAVGFSIGLKGYISTGFNGTSRFADHWEYDPGYTYSWSSGETTQSITASTAGSYTVTVTDSYGCSVTSAATVINVLPSPTAVINPAGTVNICQGSSTTLAATEADGIWIPKADFGGSVRGGAIGFSIGNKGYIGLGTDIGNKKDFWEYDPATNLWTQKADFGGTARRDAVGFSVGSKGYIGTGWDGSSKKDFWEYDPATNLWIQKADFGGTARYYAVGFSIGSKGYIGTGNDGSNKKDFWEYDPATNLWTQKVDFGGSARGGAVGFSIGNKGYIGTGTSVGYYKDFWEYNPVNNNWTQKANFGGSARVGAIGFSIGSKGYIGTGLDGSNKKDFWEYDPATNLWTQKTDFGGTARRAAVGFSVGSKGYIGTGWDGVNVTTYKKDFWEYDTSYTYSWSSGETIQSITSSTAGSYTVTVTDGYGCSATSVATIVNTISPSATINPPGPVSFCPGGNVTLAAPASDLWTAKLNFGGTTRYRSVGFSIGLKGFIGTGYDGVYKKDFWEYNAATNTWTQKADFSGTARNFATGFSIGSKGYIGTGFDGAYKKDFWEYDPVGNVWTQKTDFGGTARFGATGFNIGSKGYIGTGQDISGYEKDVWEYDPVANTWMQKTDFGGTARNFATGFSIGSKGYIGTGNDGVRKNDFWEYNPLTNIWTQKTDFGGTARNFATGFSIGTKGYIGTGNDGIRKNDFWEYDPTTNTWLQKTDFAGTARQNAVGFSIGSKAYIGTGDDAVFKNDFWEYDPGYSYSWSSTETTQSIAVSTAGNYTVALTDVFGCSATSAATVVNLNSTNTWTGGGTNNWSTGSNWTCGIPPNHPQIDAVILNNAVPMPLLTSNVQVRDLALNGNATVDINGNTLTINRAITGSGTLKGSASSNLTLNGDAGTLLFATSAAILKDLYIADTASTTLGTALSIAAGASPGTVTVNTNAVLNTGGNLTLKSDVNGTSRIGALSGSIIGDVTVERYIHTGITGGAHTKTWQFLATPTTGQTIRQAWQENGTTPAGFGTIITGTGIGFDITTALPSLKFFNDAAVNWTAVTNTNTSLQNKLGYMLFVRGDRTVNTSGAAPNNTVLRSTGTLFQPGNPPASVTVAANKFQTFGNPYASRIEFSKVLAISAGINDVFYVWDPKLAGNYNVGGYQTITGLAGYIPTVGTPPTGNPATDFYPAGVPAPFIESGQAVFVKGNGTGGSVNFNETVKANGSRLVNRPGSVNNNLANRRFIFASLFTNTGIIADGNIVAFQDGLGNEVNENDALKIMNGGENFGIKRSDSILAVEARNEVMKHDTIFYYLQNLKKQLYEFRFAPLNMRNGGLHAYLVDRFKYTSSEVSMTDSSFISFSVTEDAGSQASDRFIMVFKKTKKAPYKTNPLYAEQEKGFNFNNAKLQVKPGDPSIAVYPNPVVDQKIYIRFSNQPKGIYRFELSNKLGQVVYNGIMYLNPGTVVKEIQPDNILAAGSYQLSITAEDGKKTNETIIVP